MAINPVTGIAGGSVNSFLQAYKIHYLPMAQAAINTEANLNGYMRSNKQGAMLQGKYSLTNVRYRNVQSAGASRFEYDDLPPPSAPSYENPEIFAKNLYDRVRITGDAVRAAKGGKQAAWVKPMMEQLQSAREQGILNRNRKGHLGLYEPLATLSQYVHGTGVCTVYAGSLRTSNANERFYADVDQYIREGMEVGFIAASGGNVDPNGDPIDSMAASANHRTISSLDESAQTFTLSAPTTTDFNATDDNVLVVPWRSRVDTPGSEDADHDAGFANPYGLADMIFTGTEKNWIYGLDRDTYPWLEGNVLSNSGTARAWTESLITQALDRSARNRFNGGMEATDLMTSRAVRYEYIAETEADRRFTPIQTKKGWGRLSFTANDKMLPLLVDRDAPHGLLYGLAKKTFKWFNQSSYQPLTGGPRFVADKDAMEWIHHESGNFACWTPPANFVVDDLQATIA